MSDERPRGIAAELERDRATMDRVDQALGEGRYQVLRHEYKACPVCKAGLTYNVDFGGCENEACRFVEDGNLLDVLHHWRCRLVARLGL